MIPEDPDSEPLRTYVQSALRLHGLELPPERETAVLRQFRLLTEMAQRCERISLLESAEPAPIFRL